MFINHLTFFISFISALLFTVRLNRLKPYEVLLWVFTIIYTVSSATWLVYNHYFTDLFNKKLIDSSGIIIENFLLFIPVFGLWALIKKTSSIFKYVVVLIFINIIIFWIHFTIANNDLVFYPTNTNIISNVILQISVNIFCYLLFLVLTKKISKENNLNTELFDGNFKYIFISIFTLYYLQDTIVLLSFVLGYEQVILYQSLYYVSIILNLIFSLFLVSLSVYINWLKELNALRIGNTYSSNIINPKLNNTNSKVKLAINSNIDMERLRAIKVITWQNLISEFETDNSELFCYLESLDYLTKTEKTYAFFSLFNFTQKELSDLMNVSIRTVETNLYRMRVKLKDKNESLIIS